MQDALIDALTFNAGLILFLYVFGKVFSINYFAELDEDTLILAIFVASIFLISIPTDKYYKNIRKRTSKLFGGKNGKKHK
jgi:hypothetical protein